jgi:hypothetical protein
MCPRLLRNVSQPEQLARLNAQIECEQPTSDLYKFSGKIEIFPNEANLWDESLLSNRTSGQSARTLQHAYKFDGIELQNIRTRNGDITSQHSGTENGIALKRASVVDGNASTNHNRDPSSHRTSINRSTHSQYINSALLDESSFATGDAAMNQTSSSNGAATVRERSAAIQTVGDKTDVSTGVPSDRGHISNRSTVTGDVNVVESEIERYVSSEAHSSTIDSALLRETVRNSIISDQESVTEYSARQFDSLFQDTNTSPLGTENLLLRGARLKNTEFVIGKFHSISLQLLSFSLSCVILHSSEMLYT